MIGLLHTFGWPSVSEIHHGPRNTPTGTYAQSALECWEAIACVNLSGARLIFFITNYARPFWKKYFTPFVEN